MNRRNGRNWRMLFFGITEWLPFLSFLMFEDREF